MRTWCKISSLLVSLTVLAAGACNGGRSASAPTDIALGDTAVVAIANPPVNEANSATIPPPGPQRAGVPIAFGDMSAVTTDSGGVAVLANLAAGTAPLLVGPGSVGVTLIDRELRELAIAQVGDSAAVMADVSYPFAGMEIVEIDPGMTIEQVNAALNGSHRIVLVHGATYEGNIVFNGSNVTLFGEGAQGGRVTFVGDVEVNGSDNRVRGAHVTGNMTVDGSGFGMSFTAVDGAFSLNGSDATLLLNTFCVAARLTGGNLTALGNAGLAPLAAPPGACP